MDEYLQRQYTKELYQKQHRISKIRTSPEGIKVRQQRVYVQDTSINKPKIKRHIRQKCCGSRQSQKAPSSTACLFTFQLQRCFQSSESLPGAKRSRAEKCQSSKICIIPAQLKYIYMSLKNKQTAKLKTATCNLKKIQAHLPS